MKIYRIFVGVIAILALMMVLLMSGIKLIGLTPYTVLSGSMEPTYHVGSVIYVKKSNPEALKENNPITFCLDGVTVTHRITRVENSDEGLRFYTKGDANNMEDGGFITPDDIIGVPVFYIPFLGYVFDYVQHPPGLYIVVGSVLFIVILSFLQSDDEPKSEEEKENST